MEMQTVFKVASWDFGTAFSLFTRGKSMELEYRKFYSVSAPLGGIFAFDTLEHASHFAELFRKKLYRKIRIYEATTSLILPTPELVSKNLDDESIHRYHHGDTIIETIPPPLGTIICKDLLLETLLQEYESRYDKARS